MLGHRALTMQDYKTILKRRWWIIAIPAIIFPIVGFGISYLVQPQYMSQTLVLVEQQKVPESYVKAVVTEDLNGRLATMKEQILSRSRLQPIIERFNLFANGKLSMDDRIDMTRKNIGITPIQSEIARTNGLPGFYISFKANDARTAQLVCGEIQSLFVSENLNDRAASAAGTTDFLKGQLADAKAKLDEQDQRLREFEQKYMGKLPGAESSNINMMSSLNTQLDAATQALNRLEQDKSYVESQLAIQLQNQAAQTSQHGGGLGPQGQDAELQQLLAQEADLTTRYTDDYPDVVSVRRKIAELRQKMASAPPPPVVTTTAAPTKPTIDPAIFIVEYEIGIRPQQQYGGEQKAATNNQGFAEQEDDGSGGVVHVKQPDHRFLSFSLLALSVVTVVATDFRRLNDGIEHEPQNMGSLQLALRTLSYWKLRYSGPCHQQDTIAEPRKVDCVRNRKDWR